MKKIRFILSIWVCKILISVGKIMGKKGSATPGVYALKVCPNVLKILSKKVKCGIIAVCGTNGKTTTNNLIDKILTKKGYKVVCNNIGANMLSGVVTAFIEKCDIFGNLDCDFATLEMDEAFSVKIFEHLTPDVMVITNLFRDQLDRYGEVELTAGYLKKALDIAKSTRLIVNGDDPILVKMGEEYGEFLSFGVLEDVINNETQEVHFCPRCNEKLKYNYSHYSKLGDFNCEKCLLKRPELDFYAKKVDLSDGLSFECNDEINIKVNYRGFYNVYNILASLLTVKTLGIDLDNINEILSDYKPQVARMEQFNLKKPAILNLAKNPAGFNQAFATVLSDRRKKDIIIALNDCESDGMDISWIWDVDFDSLSDETVNSVTLCGLRRDELNVRMKYSSFNKECTVYENLKEAVEDNLKKDGEVLYLLVNYTVIFDAEKILRNMEGNE